MFQRKTHAEIGWSYLTGAMGLPGIRGWDLETALFVH